MKSFQAHVRYRSSDPNEKKAQGAWPLVILFVASLLTACTGKLGGSDDVKLGDVSCPEGTLDCGGSCRAVNSDAKNCGVCGKVCEAGEFCEAGLCVGFCPDGEIECNGVCVVTASDPTNCGVCERVCPESQVCDRGDCSDTCSGTLCDTPSGVQECADLASNNNHCRECGNSCGDGQSCVAGECVTACPPGRTMCAGICVDTRTDPSHCGECDLPCDPGDACVEATCGAGMSEGCDSSELLCNDACIDPKTNPLHCDGCGNECATGQNCVGGDCICPAGTELCAGACVDTQSDVLNCDGCGNACGVGTSCQAGDCVCDTGLLLCGDACIDDQKDRDNCGECGRACENHEECVAGDCIFEADGCLGKALDIDITRVSAYQSLELDLFREGALVEAAARNVALVQDRKAMVRVFVDPSAGFSARELSARVFVDNGGGAQGFFTKKVVSTASEQGDLDTTIQVEIPADVIREGARYWVELAECTPGAIGLPGAARIPQTGDTLADLGALEVGSVRVVMVPFVHDGQAPDTSDATMAIWHRYAEMRYPATEIDWSFHAPVPSGQTGLVDTGDLLNDLQSLRDSESPDRGVYYYGMIRADDGTDSTGLGNLSTRTETSRLSAVGIANPRSRPDFFGNGISTFPHELGHNHGRQHVLCRGNEGNPDRNYPHSGGDIGAWGYNEDEGILIPPSTADLMTYCDPEWVSDYTYNALTDMIIARNEWAAMSPDLFGPVASWRRMFVGSDGSAEWGVTFENHGPPEANPEPGLIYDSNGVVIAQVDVYRGYRSHSDSYSVVVPEPEAGWHSVSVPGGPTLAF